MELAQQVRIASTETDAPSRNVSIILGCSVLALVMFIAIYFATGEPGTAAADFVIVGP